MAGGANGLLRLLGIGILPRILVLLAILAGTMIFEWRRGDVFASVAAATVLGGMAAAELTEFASDAAYQSGVPKLPLAMALLTCGYLALVAWRLPNPGLLATVLLVAGAYASALYAPPANGDAFLAPVLGALVCATGTYAWMANASPAMVWAPLLIVVTDVLWTLARRVLRKEGRAALGAATLMGTLRGWAMPGKDMLTQRVALERSRGYAMAWLIGSTLAMDAVGLVGWVRYVRWPYVAVALVGTALVWAFTQWRVLSVPPHAKRVRPRG